MSGIYDRMPIEARVGALSRDALPMPALEKSMGNLRRVCSPEDAREQRTTQTTESRQNVSTQKTMNKNNTKPEILGELLRTQKLLANARISETKAKTSREAHLSAELRESRDALERERRDHTNDVAALQKVAIKQTSIIESLKKGIVPNAPLSPADLVKKLSDPAVEVAMTQLAARIESKGAFNSKETINGLRIEITSRDHEIERLRAAIEVLAS